MASAKARISTHLPIDTISEIIWRLPVKSLLRFKSVCKSWYRLIQSPAFVAKHLECSSVEAISPFLFHLGTFEGKPNVLSLLREDTLEVAIEYEIPASIEPHICGFRDIVGSCDGLLVVNASKHLGTSFILWNPATGQFRHLPKAPAYPESMSFELISFGFSFNPEDRTDHKLVRIVYLRGKVRRELEVHVAIYAESTDSWREIGAAMPTESDERYGLSNPYILRNWMAEAVVDGILHWAAITNDEACTNSILAFDMKNEVFQQIPLPASGMSPSDHFISLVVFRGCLGILNTPCIFGLSNSYYDLWVMREYGNQNLWTKQFVFGPFRDPPRKIVGCWENGEIFINEYWSEPRLHDPNSQLTKLIPMDRMPACSLSYKESLVSVNPKEQLVREKPVELS